MDDDGHEDDDDDDSPSATPLDTPSATPVYGSPVHDTPVHDSQDDDDDDPMDKSKEVDDMTKGAVTPASSGSVEQSDSASSDEFVSAARALESATLLKKRARLSSEQDDAVLIASLSSSSTGMDRSLKKSKTMPNAADVNDSDAVEKRETSAALWNDGLRIRAAATASARAAIPKTEALKQEIKVEKPLEQTRSLELGQGG